MRKKRTERLVAFVLPEEKKLLLGLLEDGETVSFRLRKMIYQEARRRGLWPQAGQQTQAEAKEARHEP